MFALLAKIFGSDKAVSKGLDLIDDLVVTEEEEVRVKNEAKINLLKSYAPFKLAQRYLSLMFGFTFISCFALTLYMHLTGHPTAGVGEIISEFYIGEIMLTTVFFYFGGGAIEGYLEKK